MTTQTAAHLDGILAHELVALLVEVHVAHIRQVSPRRPVSDIITNNNASAPTRFIYVFVRP
jgi:hypothetical protein